VGGPGDGIFDNGCYLWLLFESFDGFSFQDVLFAEQSQAKEQGKDNDSLTSHFPRITP
jgi:hypothetical protein